MVQRHGQAYNNYYTEPWSNGLREQFGYSKSMEVPRITKITLNMGVGEAVGDRKVMEHAVADMTRIAGQKPIVVKARKSVAGFKVREGWPVGCKVTLRRERMYEFLDRLINIAIPRIRDFRGMNPQGPSTDAAITTWACRNRSSFPEIDYDKIDALRGMDITFTTTGKDGRRRTRAAGCIQLPVQELRYDTMAKEFHDCPRTQADTRRQAICRQTRRAEGDHQQSEGVIRRALRRRSSSCRKCRVTPAHARGATVAA